MDAETETDMAAGIAIDIEAIGFFPTPWVAIGRCEEEDDLAPR